MSNQSVRTRFAPAPTGMMHLGNIRTALINYLFAQKSTGTFILRIEDTDPARNFDPYADNIKQDLAWLHITFDEGPGKEGDCGPYFQSQRLDSYIKNRIDLEKKGAIYRCFCTQEELEKKKERQKALKLPPRYDKTCTHKSDEEIQELLENKTPFIWRFKLDHEKKISITDLARRDITFDLSNFSDFPITRQDGTFTFMFANAIDDIEMRITHVFRGEDHLTNTAGQVAIMDALGYPLPLYWHLPIICNVDGKKLSKRDFGFSLRDLKNEGYLPEAITNYLGIIGGSFKNEILSMEELIEAIDFENINQAGQITYAVDKLQWINKEWIKKIAIEKLVEYCKPFLHHAYPACKDTSDKILAQLLEIAKTEMTTLADSAALLKFYFSTPQITETDLSACISQQYKNSIVDIIQTNLPHLCADLSFVDQLKKDSQAQHVPIKEIFWFLRLCLMASTKGPAIHELVSMLGVEESRKRIEFGLLLLKKI